MTTFAWVVLIGLAVACFASYRFAVTYSRPMKVRDEHERGIW